MEEWWSKLLLDSTEGVSTHYTISAGENRQEIASVPQTKTQTKVHRVLIHGPEGSGKTAMAMSLATSLAAAGERVAVIGNQMRIEGRMPLCVLPEAVGAPLPSHTPVVAAARQANANPVEKRARSHRAEGSPLGPPGVVAGRLSGTSAGHRRDEYDYETEVPWVPTRDTASDAHARLWVAPLRVLRETYDHDRCRLLLQQQQTLTSGASPTCAAACPEWDPAALSLVGICYSDGVKALLHTLCSMHRAAPELRPRVLVLEDVDLVIATVVEVTAVASAVEAALRGLALLANGCIPKLIVTSSHGGAFGPLLLDILRKRLRLSLDISLSPCSSSTAPFEGVGTAAGADADAGCATLSANRVWELTAAYSLGPSRGGSPPSVPPAAAPVLAAAAAAAEIGTLLPCSERLHRVRATGAAGSSGSGNGRGQWRLNKTKHSSLGGDVTALRLVSV